MLRRRCSLGRCLLCLAVLPLLLVDRTDETPLIHDHLPANERQLTPINLQADQQRLQRPPGQLCPGVPTETSDLIACRDVTSFCTSDDECAETNQICCFNGCIFTCLASISPPPALDWLEEPPLNSIETHNQSSQENEGFVSCSTTIRRLPSHVQACPEGFRCNVFEAGDPISGAPNKGMCVAEPPTETVDDEKFVGEDSHFHAASTKETVFLPGGCLLTNGQYDDLESFLKGGHYSSCQCQKGSVQCKVNYNSTLVIDLAEQTSPPTSFTIIEGSLIEEDVMLPMD